MAVAAVSTASAHQSAPNAAFGTDWEVALSVPLELDILRCLLEVPLSQLATAFEFFLQTLTIGTKLRVREVLATDFKEVEEELIRHVAADLIDLLTQRFHLIDPAIRGSELGTEFIVVRVPLEVISIAAVNDRSSEATETARIIPGAFGIISRLEDRELELIHGVHVVLDYLVFLFAKGLGVVNSHIPRHNPVVAANAMTIILVIGGRTRRSS